MPSNSETFWSRVLFRDFIRHFRKMTPEEVAADIEASMDALEDLNPDGESFGSLMVRWANERMNGAFATAARENGKKGGRPRKNQETTADGDIREDSMNTSDGSNAAALESRPSANLYGAAPHREAGDESATGSNHYDQETDQTSAPSGQTIDSEARQSLGAGEAPPLGSTKKDTLTSPALPVISFGEFGNIKMTNMQYAKLCERFNFADAVIEEADQYFEAQPAKKKKYKNHYAMLLSWCKRRATESTPKQGFKTAAEKQRDELQKIADYYASKEVVG